MSRLSPFLHAVRRPGLRPAVQTVMGRSDFQMLIQGENLVYLRPEPA